MHTAVCAMHSPVSSFVFHSSLLTVKGVNLVSSYVLYSSLLTAQFAVACDGFLLKWKTSIFFTVAALITEVLFKQFLIRKSVVFQTLVTAKRNGHFTFLTIIIRYN